MYLQLYQIKKHLNLDETFGDDDEYLMDLANMAQNTVAHHIDCNLSRLEDANGNLPMAIIHAMLLLVGTMYAKRETIVFGGVQEVPLAYEYLLSQYRDYTGEADGVKEIGG